MSGGTGPLSVRQFGPLDALHAVLRRRLPQVLVAHVKEPEEYVRVTYRTRGPADIAWDADAGEFRWAGGVDPTHPIGGNDDIEEAVGSIAVVLDAALTGTPPTL